MAIAQGSVPQETLSINDTASATASKSVDPISRSSLHDMVVERLRTLIVEGDLAPESRVPEMSLCRHLGVSRTPMREALKVLAAEGLVTLVPHQGAVVTSLDPKMIDHVFQVLESLEPLAGDLACAQMPQAVIDNIRQWHDQMVSYYDSGKRSEYFKLNQRIHETIVRECGNPVLADVYEGLGARVRYARYLVNFSKTSWQQAVEEHIEIMQALEARDGKRLARILKRHLRHKKDYVKSARFTAKSDKRL